MSASQFHAANRGVLYRAPTMRIDHCPVVTTAEDGPVRPGWLAPRSSKWRPLRVAWGANGQVSTLTAEAILSRKPGRISRQRAEEVELADGDMMVLVQVGQGGRRHGRAIEWFRGYAGRRRTLIEPDRERVVATAYGPEILIEGKTIRGRWHKNATADDLELAGELSAEGAVRSAVFQSDLPAVFNEDGRPNASRSAWRLTTDKAMSGQANACKVFEAPERYLADGASAVVAAEHWTAYTALRSLVEYWDDYEVISPHTPWGQIASLLGDTPIGEVSVDGMDLARAIKAVLLPVGFGFALEPWTVGNGADQWGRGRHRLLVFSLGDPSVVKSPRLAPIRSRRVAMDSARGRATEVQRLDFDRDCRNVANDVLVLGGQKRVQIVLEFHNDADTRDLHPLWDLAAHDLANWADGGVIDPWRWSGSYDFEQFADMYNRGGAEHLQHRHVLRSFAWNEDGALSGLISRVPDLTPYGAGPAGCCVRRPRPLGSSLTYDSDSQKARVHARQVQLGIVGDDDSWIDIPAEIWNDRAGFTIATALLAGNTGDGAWYPYAHLRQAPRSYRDVHYLTLLHNALRDEGDYKLRLRLIGSIECDRAVRGSAPRRVASAWPFRAEKALRLGGRFRWRQVEDNPFGQDAHCACVDDSAQAAAYAQRLRDAGDNADAHGSITLRYVTRAYSLGDAVGQTAGRAIDLHLDGGGRNCPPVVVGVVWDFADGANKTELLLAGPPRTSR